MGMDSLLRRTDLGQDTTDGFALEDTIALQDTPMSTLNLRRVEEALDVLETWSHNDSHKATGVVKGSRPGKCRTRSGRAAWQGCLESAKGPHPTVPQRPCLGIHPDLELSVIGCWKRQVDHPATISRSDLGRGILEGTVTMGRRRKRLGGSSDIDAEPSDSVGLSMVGSSTPPSSRWSVLALHDLFASRHCR